MNFAERSNSEIKCLELQYLLGKNFLDLTISEKNLILCIERWKMRVKLKEVKSKDEKSALPPGGGL